MTTIDNLHGQPGDGNGQYSGSLLPSIRQSADLVTRIRQDLEKIDSLMGSIRQKAGGGGPFGGSTGAGSHSNGMPRAIFGGSGGGLQQDIIDSYAVAGSLGGGAAGGGGGAGGHSNGMPRPAYSGAPLPIVPLGNPGGGQPGYPTWMKDLAIRGGQGAYQSLTARTGQFYTDDLVWNRMRMSANFGGGVPGYSNSTSFQDAALPHQLANAYGAGSFGTSDITGGVAGLLNSGVSAKTMLGKDFSSNLTGASMLTGLGIQATAGIESSMLSNSNGLYMGRVAGIRMRDNNGQPLPLGQTLSDVFRATGGRGIGNVGASLTNFGSLSQNLKGFLGVDQATVTQLGPLFQYAAQHPELGDINLDPKSQWGKSFIHDSGSSDKALTDLMKRGKGNSLVDASNAYGTRQGMDAANTAAASLATQFSHLEDVMKGFTGTITGAGGFFGALANKPDGSSSVMGNIATNLPNDLIQAMFLKKLAGVGGTQSGSVMSSRSALGNILSSRSLKLGLGAMGTAMATGLTADLLASHGHKTAAKVVGGLGGAASSALTGAALGSMIGPEGTIGGAVIGGVVGGIGGLLGGLGMGAAGDNAPSQNGTVVGGGGVGSILNFAQTELGTPYSWGGGSVAGPSRGIKQGASTVGFDCSSFVQFVFGHFGINLPRTTFEQVKYGKPVSPQNAAPGDLLFFGSATAPDHVAIYMGNGKIIEAPHTGAAIRIRACSPSAAATIRRVVNGSGYSAAGVPTGNGGTVGISGALSAISSARSAATQLHSGLDPSSALSGLLGGGSSPLVSSASATGDGGAGSGGGAPASGSETYRDLVSLARGAGFNDNYAPIMAAIALAESSGNPRSHNTNRSTGDNSYGLWQINMLGSMGPGRAREFGIKNYDELLNPQTNAHAAYDIWRDQGFNAWSTYKSGAYKKYLAGHDKGGTVTEDHLAVVHKGEEILPANGAAQSYRSRGGQGGGKTVILNVYPANCSHPDAVRLVQMVKRELDHDKELTNVSVG